MFLLSIIINVSRDRPNVNKVNNVFFRRTTTAEEAVQAVIEGVKDDDTQLLLTIFGPGSRKIIFSGDPVDDREGREWFIKRYEERGSGRSWRAGLGKMS